MSKLACRIHRVDLWRKDSVTPQWVVGDAKAISVLKTHCAVTGEKFVESDITTFHIPTVRAELCEWLNKHCTGDSVIRAAATITK